MKIWCETCNGKGMVGSVDFETFDCEHCNGKGYTENESIEYEARVGRVTIKAFDKGCWITNMSGVYYENIHEFVESEEE